MARVRKVVNFCDRHTTDEPATTTTKFSLNGVDWEIDLCEQHADMLQRDIMGWARLAREKERPSMFRSSEEVRAYTHSDYGSGQHNGLEKKAKPEPAAIELPALPAVADNWKLTPHAEEQLEDRGPVFGFTRVDVFLCATQPEHTLDGSRSGKKQYFRGNVQLVVDEFTKTVVTVLPRSTRDFQDQEQELASATSI